MENRLSIRGNAVQPVLVMFPLGLLAVAVLLDVFRLLGGPGIIGTLAYCTVIAGLLGGLTTALTVHLGEITGGNRARARTAARRFLLDGAVLLIFAVVLLLRMRTPERTAGPGLLVVEVLGLGLAVIAGVTGALPRGPGRPGPGAGTVRLAQILDDPADHRRHEDHEPKR
ncbi:DUF2231 domain-containing protein [Actinoplanes nipponensis]|nr:DUF2231 domain-containing protein [Actinoplanes nipponensis]